MSRDDISAARSLAFSPETDRFSDTDADSPIHTHHRRSLSHSASTRPRLSHRSRWRHKAESYYASGLRLWNSFTPLQKLGIVILNIILSVLGLLFLIFSHRIFAALGPFAERWRNLPAGWLILWSAVFFVSFPPMIGYSTCVTLAGFVFGVWKGWLIMASGTILGSTCAFLASRTVLKGYATRLAESNAQFAALSLVLKHDGLKLLVMIRLCPLPYSFSNGAISTIATVTWSNFMIATAAAAPKLVLGVFVGSRLGDLAENGDKMDVGAKVVSYVGIFIGVVAGIGTGYLVYVRTQARAKQLEAEEAAASGVRGARRASDGGGPVYSDDLEDAALRRSLDEDNISLHTTGYRDEEEAAAGGDPWRGYGDEDFLDDDAQERDVFAEGDGGYESEEVERKKRSST